MSTDFNDFWTIVVGGPPTGALAQIRTALKTIYDASSNTNLL